MSPVNPITPISSLPTFVTPEQHANLISSTPSSFADIPPVLKHSQPNVRITLDPPVQGFDPTATTDGTLYVLTSVLVYFTASGQGFQIPYPSITLHAISRSGSSPSIYCQLDAGAAPDADVEDEDADTLLQELSIIPKDPASLDQIFEALSTCAALHPDPDADLDGDEDDATIDRDPLSTPFVTFNGSAEEELSEVGRAALAHMESIINDPFDHDDEDAYEGEDGDGEELPPDSEDDDKKDVLEDADEENGPKGEKGEKETEAVQAVAENKPISKAT